MKPCKHPCCPDAGPCRKATHPKKPANTLKRTKTRQKSPQTTKVMGLHAKAPKTSGNRPKMRKIAKKAVTKYTEYAKRAKLFRETHPNCEINAPGCTRATQGVHHVRGRIGDLLLDEKEWLASCNWCNAWVENNSELAFQLGLKKSKHEPNYKRNK